MKTHPLPIEGTQSVDRGPETVGCGRYHNLPLGLKLGRQLAGAGTPQPRLESPGVGHPCNEDGGLFGALPSAFVGHLGVASGAIRHAAQWPGHVRGHAPLGHLLRDGEFGRVRALGCGVERPTWWLRGGNCCRYSRGWYGRMSPRPWVHEVPVAGDGLFSRGLVEAHVQSHGVDIRCWSLCSRL